MLGRKEIQSKENVTPSQLIYSFVSQLRDNRNANDLQQGKMDKEIEAHLTQIIKQDNRADLHLLAFGIFAGRMPFGSGFERTILSYVLWDEKFAIK